jgi:hypothetical protein
LEYGVPKVPFARGLVANAKLHSGIFFIARTFLASGTDAATTVPDYSNSFATEFRRHQGGMHALGYFPEAAIGHWPLRHREPFDSFQA